ncbi:hypothetical protein [Chryseobacterium sp. SNU WT5]|uniref:hypothetical protein n=1 Tax=Chryseobacterium sp. SNU WT5 TaxID=2594269 RepID=UPI00162669E7|nr:hypothetical protein [Chryseobacterium sp. SNU WT5]
MFQLVLGFLILIFGVFLKVTKDPGFSKSKKFAWMFILIGALSIIGKLLVAYQTETL